MYLMLQDAMSYYFSKGIVSINYRRKGDVNDE